MLRRWRELRAGADGDTINFARVEELWLAPPRPYPGLRSFAAGEADVFFARDSEVNTLFTRLEQSNVIVVLGSSGSGKSSLVRAGLLPRLASGTQVPGRPGSWYSVDIRPGEDPNAELIRGLCAGLVEPVLAAGEEEGADRGLAVRAIQALLADDAASEPAALRVRAFEVLRYRLFGLDNALNIRSAALDPRAIFALAMDRLDSFDAVLRKGLRVGKPNLLIMLDQFEEVFRPGIATQGVRNLCELLQAIFLHQPPGLFIAATMRSEETHRATEAGLAEVMNQSAFHVGPVSRAEERQKIIFAPARAVFDDWLPDWQSQLARAETAPFSPALVDKLNSESQRVLESQFHGSDYLPLLQHTLLRTWDAAAERWEREAEKGAIMLEIGEDDLTSATNGVAEVLTACLELHAEKAYGAARLAALDALREQRQDEHNVDGLAFATLCSLARRDDLNNWARQFTSSDRIARLTSADGKASYVKTHAAEVFLDTLCKHGFLNRMQVRRDSQPPMTLFDVSHEALIRRWSRLRDDVLPRAEQLATDLYEVDQNLNRRPPGLPLSSIAAASEAEGDCASLSARLKSLASGAVAPFAVTVAQMSAGIRSYCHGAAEAWRAAGESCSFRRRLAVVAAWNWAWLNETPERRATETVPDRVRGTLGTVLGQGAVVPRSLAAALLSEETRHGDRGGSTGTAARDDHLECGIQKIRRMEHPWRLASDLSQRRISRPMKALLGLLILLLAAVVLWNFEVIRSQKFERQAQLERDIARTQLLAMQARRAGAEAITPDGIERAGALALESIALARDGARSAEADAVETVRNALTRLPLAILFHGSRVRSLVVLTDGRLASGGFDGLIKLWSKDQLWSKDGAGEPVVLWQGSPVRSLAALTDGRLASGGEDGLIKLWPNDGAGEPVVLRQGSEVLSLAVLTDGRLASGGFDGQIKLWPKDGIGEPTVLRQGGEVFSLAVLPDGRLASGGFDGLIKLWPKDRATEPVRQGNPVRSLVVLPDGRLASSDLSEIKLWPKDAAGEPAVLRQDSPVLSLAVLADGHLASGGKDGRVRLWPGERAGEPLVLSHGRGVLAVAVLPDGRLASGGEDGLIKLWPKDGLGEPGVLRQGSEVLSLAVLTDGRLASGGEDGLIKLRPKDGTGEPVVLWQGSPVRSLAALTDGRLASGGEDGLIKLWPNDRTGEPVVLRQGSEVLSLAVLIDGRLASGGFDGQIKLWPKDGIGEPVVLRQGSGATYLAVLRNGQLVSSGFDRINLWPKDWVGEPIVFRQGSGALAMAVLANGRLATGGFDGKIRVWRTDRAGEPVIRQQGDRITSLVGLADGRLASGGSDGQIRLWPKGGIGEPVVLHQGSPVRSMAVLADGQLASGGEDDKIRVWLADEEKLISALCLRAGRNLTKDEWAFYIGSNTPRQLSCRGRPSNWRTPDP
jgi:WD40 repeat protein